MSLQPRNSSIVKLLGQESTFGLPLDNQNLVMSLSPDVVALILFSWEMENARQELYWREVLAREGRPLVMGCA